MLAVDFMAKVDSTFAHARIARGGLNSACERMDTNALTWNGLRPNPERHDSPPPEGLVAKKWANDLRHASAKRCASRSCPAVVNNSSHSALALFADVRPNVRPAYACLYSPETTSRHN